MIAEQPWVTEEPLSAEVVAQLLSRYRHSDCTKSTIIRMLCRSHGAQREQLERLRAELERVKRERGVTNVAG